MPNLEDVFVTEGVPQYTFVQPPNFHEILIDVRKVGKPVIIEGQSGTGKTTTIKRIIEQIRLPATYLSARKPPDIEKIGKIALDHAPGLFIIDDFHHLAAELQEKLADIAKLAAEQGEEARLPKLVIIGINQVGSDLIQLVADIAKRTGIHRIAPGTNEDIAILVKAGCEKLNINLDDIGAIFRESKGDFWLTQQLCQSLCAMNQITMTQETLTKINIDLPLIRERVVTRLHHAYYPAVKEFCRGRRFRPSNDPYFKLLRIIGRQETSVADLNELANAIPDVRGSINNIKERRLQVLLESKLQCRRYFYYNSATKNFAIEDPALFYFLKHLDWTRLRADCGFREVDRDREWDVAISFAGENRELAKHIAEELEILDVHVFFDEFYENNYLGKAWSGKFKQIFGDESDLVVCLLDCNHRKKIWPTFERECFTSRLSDEEVIPVFLDDTVFAGIPTDISAIHFKWDKSDSDWKKKATNEIVLRLLDRV